MTPEVIGGEGERVDVFASVTQGYTGIGGGPAWVVPKELEGLLFLLSPPGMAILSVFLGFGAIFWGGLLLSNRLGLEPRCTTSLLRTIQGIARLLCASGTLLQTEDSVP